MGSGSNSCAYYSIKIVLLRCALPPFHEEPLRAVSWSRDGAYTFKVDDSLANLGRRQLPMVDRCQRMILRAMRELRRLRQSRPALPPVIEPTAG